MAARSTFDKIWDSHVVAKIDDNAWLIYMDRHLLHEANSPHAFEGLRNAGLDVRRPSLTVATADHVVPTDPGAIRIHDEESNVMVRLLSENCERMRIAHFGIGDERQGIVHVIAPELGLTLPGSTIVCGDSHTCTLGAFGTWAFGIGISEVEHVLATQTLVQSKPKNMRVTVDGDLAPYVSSKDVVLALIGKIGTAGAAGHVIEFAGSTVRGMSMAGRMTLCNMAAEAGARGAIVAPDETTMRYLQGRTYAPKKKDWPKATALWQELSSDENAPFDREVKLNAAEIAPHVTWGTSPQEVMAIGEKVPDPLHQSDPIRRDKVSRALQYMDLSAGCNLEGLPIDRVFIGSCTNGRIEDLRVAAEIVRDKKVASTVQAWVVPGSQAVKRQAEAEGLDVIFRAAGMQWRNPGCSMCLAMNGDELMAGERCASTSNRNFEGRQGSGGRTHLMSPAMAASAALAGQISDVRKLGG